jgi:hypothetical protein
MKRKANRLINENSPYLKQHAYNPVNWYPWGEEALNKAINENKLIFISIGYAACHWCHVMEKESFSDENIAKKLNADFVCIKIDREERPDLDQTYMSAVQLMAGGGGWPLSCFTTPEGKPFYGGTYYRPDQFMNILTELNNIWLSDPEKIKQHAEGLCEGIRNSELVQEKNFNDDFLDVDTVFNKIKDEFDYEYGGFNRVPKFPLPSVYQFLIRYYHYSKNEQALKHVTRTLESILTGGIYDQIGGGIARYSTDKYWLIPHFEKMLYDNAQFISLLADTYMVTSKKLYLNRLYQTIEFLDRELKSPEGGYYSSLDADSEGEEGKYYVWKDREIREIAGKDRDLVMKYYGITAEGNWENGKNILYVHKNISSISDEVGMNKEELRKKFDAINKSLLEHRELKEKPLLDTKILTSWNAILIKAFVEAYQATGDENLKEKAVSLGSFLLKEMVGKDYMVYRTYDKKSNGFLDDYAYLAKALIYLYQVSFDESWLTHVKGILDRIFEDFYNDENDMFYYSAETEQNPVTRQLELTDNVIPSSNSALGKVLFYASIYFDEPKYLEISRQMLLNMQPHISRSPSFFSNWLALLLLFNADFSEIVISGKNALEIRRDFCRVFIPDALFAGTADTSELSLLRGRMGHESAKVYICQNRTCKMPVNTANEALKLLKSGRS